MLEIWKDIKGYEGFYQVSNLGKVRSLNRFKLVQGISMYIKGVYLRQMKNKDGYFQVGISKNNIQKSRRVHRLVAQAFIPNPENKPQINHLDGNKQNNCVDNLEWTTASENNWHAYNVLDSLSRREQQSLRMQKNIGALNPNFKGKILCVETGEVYSSAFEASKILGLHHADISAVLNKKLGRYSVGSLHFNYV